MALLREDKSLKPDFTYFAICYGATARIANRFKEGELKYARLNWREAKDIQTYKESTTRHLFQYLNGETDEDHLSAVVVNTMILMDLEEMKKMEKTNETAKTRK